MVEMAYGLWDVIVFAFVCCSFFSDGDASYQELILSNPKVCNLTGKKGKIKLSQFGVGAVVTEGRSFDKWPGLVKFHCQFEVRDTNDNAVFAVIQELKFRKEDGECLDYVEFRGDDGQNPRKFCDDITPPLNSVPVQSSEIASNAYIDGKGEVHVTVHVASQRLEPDEQLVLKIAFTSAKRRCYQSTSSSVSSHLINCGNQFCISREFANDGIVNCPFEDCKDENGTCFPMLNNPTYHRPSVGTKVTIGAITTVLVSFLLFFACIWLLRHYRKMCWAADFSNQRDLQMTPLPPPGSGPHDPEAGTAALPNQTTSMNPTAPPLDSPEATILPDKDLPPSYDSLFPSGSPNR